ncbi:MAG: DUF6159 family protein [Saprospiraceae bacterium]
MEKRLRIFLSLIFSNENVFIHQLFTSMNIFDRMRTGWHLGITSLEVIGAHPRLLLFPVISGISLIAIALSFVGTFIGIEFMNPDALQTAFNNESINEVVIGVVFFLFYVISYFIIIFFNVALVYGTRKAFDGEEPSIGECLSFSAQRAHRILAWAALAATVGMVLQAVEES